MHTHVFGHYHWAGLHVQSMSDQCFHVPSSQENILQCVCVCMCVQVIIIGGDYTSIRWVAIVSLFRLVRMGRLFSIGAVILQDIQRVGCAFGAKV